MPTELVLLCDVEPPSALVGQVGERLFPGGSLMVNHDGRVRRWVDAQGRVVLSLFAGRTIVVRADADRAVVGGTGGYGCWVDMTVPYGDATGGWALAEALGGRVAQRS